jgi:hypothetical protein
MDVMDFDLDEEDDLSTALGTESLAAKDMVPEGFDNTPRTRRAPEQLIQGRRYLKVDQSANTRKNSKISKIWQHGSELRALDTPNLDKHWLCNLCLPTKRLYKVSSSGGNNNTTAPARHLSKVHRISLKEDEDSETNSITTSSPAPAPSIATMMTTASQASYNALVSRINIEKFRWLLLKWIIQMHIVLIVVESDSFRELVLFIAPALESFLVQSANTIRRWILQLFDRQSLVIKKKLARARSRIHISFDLWTSPNHRAFVGIVAHWLDEDLKKQDVLIGLRRVRGSHSGENIAEAVIPLLQMYEIGPKLGYFVGDNIGSNDTGVRCILQALRPDIRDPDSRRVRCIGHIINLVAKAFLFGQDVESLEGENLTKEQISKLLAVRKDWLTNGPYGKLHNTVNFIRDTPQRRDEWFSIANSGIEEEFEGE